MTQQTKTVEMVAKLAAKKIQRLIANVVGGYDTGDDSMEAIIRQAISDAVKGTGAVEALEKAMAREYVTNFHQLLSDPPLNASAWRMQNLSIKPAIEALRALTLPDHPTK